MLGMNWSPLYAGLLLSFVSLTPAWAGDVTIKLQGNYTVTTGTSKISVPTSWMQAGHAYTLTSTPVSGNVTAYGDPYLWSVVYVDGSTTRRVVYQSRHTPDQGERAHLQEDMWNTGENKAEFWVRCEVASCYMKLTVYEREEGTFDRKTFYRDGVEYRVIDGQFSLYKDFYHPTEKNGDYGLQVNYEADRYLYLYRDDNFSTSNVNALSFWVRSSGSIDEDDLTIALTTGDHYLLTNWLPLSDYIEIEASHTWYRVIIPLSDLNPSDSSVRGLAIQTDRSGFVYFDDVAFSNEDLGGGGEFQLRLPLDGYTPYNVPVSAVMDNSIGVEGLITTHNNQEGRFEDGCKEYVSSGVYADCTGTVSNYNPPSEVLGYKRTGGGSFSLGINYNDGVSGGEYIFYDEHTGYDFVPAGAANLNVPVYAAASGTVSYGNGTWNEVIITSVDGATTYTTHYLHMEDDDYLIANGATVTKGDRIGTVGGMGGVSPHLHLTVRRNGTRIDPYREGLWE